MPTPALAKTLKDVFTPPIPSLYKVETRVRGLHRRAWE